MPTTHPQRSEHIAAVAEQTAERLSGIPVDVVCRDGTVTTLHVGKLYLDQLAALTQFSRKVWAAFRAAGGSTVLAEMRTAMIRASARNGADAEAKEAEDAAAKATMDAAVEKVAGGRVLEAFLEMLDAQELGTLMGILADCDSGWARRNLHATAIAEVIAAVIEENDPAVIVAAFRRGARALTRSLPGSAAPSVLPSS
jgi:hypothetical protein